MTTVKSNQELNNHPILCVCNDCIPFDMPLNELEREEMDYSKEWNELNIEQCVHCEKLVNVTHECNHGLVCTNCFNSLVVGM
jgi:hypothetical protein